MLIHPESPGKATATFTLGTGAGKFQGAATWSDTGGKAIFANQVDDAAAGTSSADVDFSAYGDGESTKLHVEADSDLGVKKKPLGVDSEQLDFSVKEDIEADGVAIAVSQAA